MAKIPSGHDNSSSISTQPSLMLPVVPIVFCIVNKPIGNIPLFDFNLRTHDHFLTFIRRSIQLSQNASISNQSLTFQSPGMKANPKRRIHIAGLNGPSKVIAERRIRIAV